ncbi:hypothetical protein Lal_00027259 [Lupinus albus]|uniref:Uncharacterized protein n=1 Tax=Lupinus albus TaxID=3870 RepID=A0A6A5PFT9_LUPAL|nr:hypothetical protein Lalb_Chr03g0038331 [Lupinus albus]KAF1896193.1 hypothetical protein Lal_00027259 [Lupinus albus]
MPRFRFFFSIIVISILAVVVFADERDFEISDFDFYWTLSHQDYSPPAPPPPPPHPSSVSCVEDLGGVGSLDTTWKIVNNANNTRDVYIAGKGNFNILPGVKFHCEIPGCIITVNVTGNFSLGANTSIVTGAFEMEADNVVFENGTLINNTGMAGDPPPQTSGTPQGIDGGGGVLRCTVMRWCIAVRGDAMLCCGGAATVQLVCGGLVVVNEILVFWDE